MMSAMHRKGVTGSVLERKLLPNMSAEIFQRDGAPAHTSKRTQDWLTRNIPHFWPKGTWPANSSDLSPIENLWSIMQDKLKSMPRPTNLQILENHLILAWRGISPDTLDKLISSMPGRISKCIQLKGGYIGK